MKKFFGRNRQYEEDMEWEESDAFSVDDSEYYEEDACSEEEYFEEETEETYEEETEAAVFFEENGGDEFFEEEPYYEDEGSFEAAADFSAVETVLETDGEIYAEEPYAEGVYEEEIYETDDIEDLSGEDEVYFEEDTDYEEEEEILAWSAMPDKNIFQKIWYSLIHMSTMDRVITTTGVLVLILAVAASSIFVSARILNKEAVSYDTVGSQLDGITLIGEHGLTAVADAQLAKAQTADAIGNEENGQDEESGEYKENDYKREVEVSMNMTSIEKDLKLKFVNSSTNKLIANVPFSVTVKTPDGKSETWTDDDMDGIIYKSDITPGNYSVAMNALTDSKYAGYTISTSAKKVTVRKEIAYEKVDVSDEIKKESELSQKEDAENQLEIESELVDTVAWVESTVTPGKVVWTAVARANLNVDVPLSAQGGNIMKMAAEAPAQLILGQAGLIAVNTPEPFAVSTNTSNGGISTITAGDNSANTETNPTPPPETETSPDPGTDPTPSPETSPSESPENPTPSQSPEEPGSDVVTELKLNKTELTLTVGMKETLTVTVEPESAKDKVVWESDKPAVATVQNGEVTAVAAGTAKITAKAGDKTVECTVTVTDANVNITIDPASISILSGESKELTVTITGGSASGQITAASNNGNIATASAGTPATADGKTTVKVTVKGVGAGTATITVTYKIGNVEKSATATVKVIAKDNKLVDKNNNQIWVKAAEDKYVEATYADYYNTAITTFYLRTETAPRYTGWQSIDGKMYYFDANGNKVTGEQVIQGAKYTFASDGSLVVGSGSFGIDVSKWNGKIDWNAVKNSGVSYVIIRCGYRGYGSGALVVDPYFEQNIKGATAAGIKVGVYFFSQAVNKNEAVEEASMVLQLVRGYTISYPIFLDVEYSGAAGNTGRADKLDVATRTEIIKAFCETIRNSGYTAGVYANKSWLTSMIDTSQLSKYKIWLAQYAAAPTYTGRYDMWQYKSTGRVTGINGDVDLNLSYLGY